MTKREDQAREYAAEQETREQSETKLDEEDCDAYSRKIQREFRFTDFAGSALIGLCISKPLDTKEDIARQAFDLALALVAEFDKRRGAIDE
jgi:hypothetical protein